jgi:hypothetical protein
MAEFLAESGPDRNRNPLETSHGGKTPDQVSAVSLMSINICALLG